MDQRSFDRLARILGEATDRRTGLKAAFGTLLGAGGAAAAFGADTEAKKGRGKDADPGAGKRKRRKTCKPACGSGFDCAKVGKRRECVCATGATCGEACCRIGQVCDGGQCVAEPNPGSCLAFGEPCKNAGRRCCDGLSCASGQDGSFPVACYRSKGAPCTSTAECPFGMSCTGGICVGNGGAPGPTCAQAGAACSDTASCCAGLTCTERVCVGEPQCVPAGGSCGGSATCCDNLPCNGGLCAKKALGVDCAADGECESGLCWYPQDEQSYPLPGAAGRQKVCVPAVGASTTCINDYQPCGLGNYCSQGVCDGSLYVPTGATGCQDSDGCYNSSDDVCLGDTCYVGVAGECTADTGQFCQSGSTCQLYRNSNEKARTFCLKENAATCTKSVECAGNTCAVASGTQKTCMDCAVADRNGITTAGTVDNSMKGYEPYTVQQALDCVDGGVPCYSDVTLAPGIHIIGDPVSTTPLAKIERSVTLEACVPSSKPQLRSSKGDIVFISAPTSGPQTVTLRNLVFGKPNDNYWPKNVVVATGGADAGKKLTLAVENCDGEIGYGGETENPEAVFDLSDGYVDGSFTNCAFTGMMVRAVSSRTSDKNGITATGCTFTGRRLDPSNVCPPFGAGNPRAFDVKNVKLTLVNTTIQKYLDFNLAGNRNNGNGIRAQGGAEIVLQGSSTIKDNQALAGNFGGGIYFDQSGDTNTLKLETTASGTPSITGNVAGATSFTYRGAGIYLTAAPTTWTDVFKGGVTSSAVSGNLTQANCVSSIAPDQCWAGTGPGVTCTFNT